MTTDEPGNWQPTTGTRGSHEHRTSADTTDVVAIAQTWLAQDPDEDTRDELTALLADGDPAALADRFAGRLEFGTAGLRGALGAGPNRMNRVVVAQAAAGLAAYLAARAVGGEPASVVIGYDARHKSDVFALDTAEIVAGAGLRAYLMPRHTPTPVLAFAIRAFGASAGVMVTASHNPPQDNGYKVYLGSGSQIIPPADTEISAEIAAVGPVSMLPRASTWTPVDLDALLTDYVARAAAVAGPPGTRDLRIVYTPMHGVGGEVLLRVLAEAGFPEPKVVTAQAEPDPDFPTVAFPNPEEPGAMDLALALAADSEADVIIANDPDADRLAVGVPGPQGWRMLRGDELGALLGDHIARTEPASTGGFAASIVSSSLLGRIAAAHGRPYVDTLTGFKWIARVEGLRFGYEEALGYCVAPADVRDKDGVSAAALAASVAASLKAQGRTLLDALDALARAYGLHATDQLAFRVEDPSLISAAMQRMRDSTPVTLGGRAVEGVDDLGEGSAELPPTEGLRYTLAGSGRVVVRPSGTEPKLKCYLEVICAVEDDEGGIDALAVAQADADERIGLLATAVTDLLGLTPPVLA